MLHIHIPASLLCGSLCRAMGSFQVDVVMAALTRLRLAKQFPFCTDSHFSFPRCRLSCFFTLTL